MSVDRPLAGLILAGCLLAVGPVPVAVAGDEPPPRPTITVRAIHPEREVEAIIHLFQGSRAANPAAALAAWKRASAEPKRLGKLGDAVIAALNPRMLREYQVLDGAELAVSFLPGADRWAWRARLPNDDGTLGVVGPTADLSGGGVEPPLGEYRVDRFPGTSGTLVARGAAGLFAASSREQLRAALAAASSPPAAPPVDSGWVVQLDPAASDTWTSAAGRRWAAAAVATGCQLLTGQLRLSNTTLVASVAGRFGGDTPSIPAIDPGWLDPIPTRGPFAAFGFRVDPRGAAWDRLFNLLDRVERTDPARANIAPARFRLALAARAGGVRLEADVWPHLQGVSGWLGMAAGQVDRGLIALHLDDLPSARLVVEGVKGVRKPDGADEVIEVGSVGGHPVRLIRRQTTMFVAWGERAWAESREALDNPERSARPWLGKSRSGALPTRVGALWPDQIPLVPPGSPLAVSLAESAPIRWAGANEGNRTFDEVWVEGLDATVRRFLDRLPLDPPPEP